MKQLAIQYLGYELPKEIQQLYDHGLGQKVLGSRSSTKLASFIDEQKIKDQMNNVMDFYAKIKPERQHDESYPEYKARQKFQKLLLKNRKYLYDYTVFDK